MPARTPEHELVEPGVDTAESKATRLNRNYLELLQELRVSETGVQVLFAFLLSLPFQQRFEEINEFQRSIYVLTLVFCTLAIALLVAPVAFHRLTFRRGLREELVAVTSKFAIAGTSFLLLSVLSALLLILDYTIGAGFAIVVTSVLGVLILLLWVALPLVRRRTLRTRTIIEQTNPQ